MNQLTYKLSYRRHLPHIQPLDIQPPGATLFVTFNLAGSLPAHVIKTLRAEAEKQLAARLRTIHEPRQQAILHYQAQKQLFDKIDRFLDTNPQGPHWLKRPEIAQLIAGSIHYRHNRVYDLDTFCLMSNHGHLLFTPLEKEDGAYHSLSRIMHSLKLYTAGQCNDILQRQGPFWHHESYDHIVRNQAERQRIRRYILQNPVRAGLVQSWAEWPWTHCRYL